MDPLVVDDTITVPADELSARFTRAQGPGGQNVNKVATRVELRFALAASQALPDEVRERLTRLAGSRLTSEGDLLITGQRHRSQAQNLDDCRERLAELIRRATVRPRPRKPTRRSRGSIERRLRAKTERGQTKRMRGRVRRDD